MQRTRSVDAQHYRTTGHDRVHLDWCRCTSIRGVARYGLPGERTGTAGASDHDADPLDGADGHPDARSAARPSSRCVALVIIDARPGADRDADIARVLDPRRSLGSPSAVDRRYGLLALRAASRRKHDQRYVAELRQAVADHRNLRRTLVPLGHYDRPERDAEPDGLHRELDRHGRHRRQRQGRGPLPQPARLHGRASRAVQAVADQPSRPGASDNPSPSGTSLNPNS